MEIIIYADFSCPYSYLASLRADQLLWSGAAEIDWRAITHSTDDGRDDRDRDLAAVAGSPGQASMGHIRWPAR